MRVGDADVADAVADAREGEAEGEEEEGEDDAERDRDVLVDGGVFEVEADAQGGPDGAEED